MAESDIPILYLFLYGILKDRFKCQTIQPSYMVETIKIRFPRIPRALCFEIFNEMEEYKLIQRINHKSYYILPNKSVKRLQHLSSSPLW